IWLIPSWSLFASPASYRRSSSAETHLIPLITLQRNISSALVRSSFVAPAFSVVLIPSFAAASIPAFLYTPSMHPEETRGVNTALSFTQNRLELYDSIILPLSLIIRQSSRPLSYHKLPARTSGMEEQLLNADLADRFMRKSV